MLVVTFGEGHPGREKPKPRFLDRALGFVLADAQLDRPTARRANSSSVGRVDQGASIQALGWREVPLARTGTQRLARDLEAQAVEQHGRSPLRIGSAS